jgi:hypothetical protein
MPYTYRDTKPSASRRPEKSAAEFLPIMHAIAWRGEPAPIEHRDAVRVILWSLKSDKVTVNLWDRINALPVEIRVEVAALICCCDAGYRERLVEQLLEADTEFLIAIRNAERDERLPAWAAADLGPMLPGMALAGGDDIYGPDGRDWLGDPVGLQDQNPNQFDS